MVGTEEVDGAKLIQASRYLRRENTPPFSGKRARELVLYFFPEFNCKCPVLSDTYQIVCHSLNLYTVVEETCLT